MKRHESLQEIGDRYLQLGYRGERLRKALAIDKDYQRLLRQRQQRLTRQFRISPAEKKRYVLATDDDFEILEKCKRLETSQLRREDKILVKLVKTQLEDDWRQYLITALNRLLRKYKR